MPSRVSPLESMAPPVHHLPLNQMLRLLKELWIHHHQQILNLQFIVRTSNDIKAQPAPYIGAIPITKSTATYTV
ncbi:hypothetical protein Tco_0834362 [Tanacetum coccineum]